MKIRNVIAALAVVLAACGEEDCPTESPDVLSVPTCSVAANVPVTVAIPICARCNETAPSCDPDLTQAGAGVIQLDTLAEACTEGSSCPVPSCGIDGPDRQTVICTFTSPPADDYQLIVFDAGSGQPVTVPFSTRGTATSCGS